MQHRILCASCGCASSMCVEKKKKNLCLVHELGLQVSPVTQLLRQPLILDATAASQCAYCFVWYSSALAAE